MFLGPLEQSKPWDTKGIDGVNRFLKRVWRLFYDRDGFIVTDEKATPEELKTLHKLIGKIRTDIEAFSFNTAVSAFMIAVNELYDLKCNKREILEQLIVLLAPFTPHIAEELWEALGHKESITYAAFPEYVEAYTIESNCTYAVSFNGKARFNIGVAAGTSREDVEKMALEHESSARWMDGKTPKKVIVVPNKIVNIVI
jgi:leucyl-tRNA synthetase